MECKKIVDIIDDVIVYKDKKKFLTLEEAITAAKLVNSKVYMVQKVVAYKCKVCHKFHIGRKWFNIKRKGKN